MTYAEANTIALYVFSFILFGSFLGASLFGLVTVLFPRKSAQERELAALRKQLNIQ
jgi:hypothetical protein